VVGVLVALGVVCCLMTAIPNFLRFGARAKAAEARTNLRALLTAERAFFAKEKRWARSFEELAFVAERGNRYRLALSREGEVLVPGYPDGGAHAILAVDAARMVPREPDSAHPPAIPRALWDTLGVLDGGLTLVATGNLDLDPTLDVWSVSSVDRVIDGAPVAAGVEWCHVDDTRL
jgi:type IV pilus assembly protein PilA